VAISTAVIAALLLATTTIRSIHDEVVISAPLASGVPGQTSIDSKRVAADVSNSDESATNHTLSLLVVRAEDRQPVTGARILVDCWRGNHMERTLDATTDGNGTLDIPLPTLAFNELIVWASA